MSQNGTIARNILIIYIRMFAMMIIEFYISRIVSSGFLPSRVIRKVSELFILSERWLIKYRIICKFLRYYKYE